MVVFPNAKINLGLHVIARRSDGYHNIESILYPINWHDSLEIVKATKFFFQQYGHEISTSAAEDNLCVRAYHLLRTDYDIPPSEIHLVKAIPVGAGLGGGSADAAFTLKALSDLYDLELSNGDLLSYCRRLGSDCSFFLRNQPQLATGRGDQLEDIQISLSGKRLVVIFPEIHISTAEAYAGTLPSRASLSLKELRLWPLAKWRENLVNDFEAFAFKKHPHLRKIKEALYSSGAIYASLSGSGSAIYGIFEEGVEIEAKFPNFRIWQETLP